MGHTPYFQVKKTVIEPSRFVGICLRARLRMDPSEETKAGVSVGYFK